MAVESSELALSIVIPAYNEVERCLEPTLRRVIDYCRAERPSSEVLVVNDGSTRRHRRAGRARSPPSARSCGSSSAGANRGKGAAVRARHAGRARARILFSDADLATPIEELDKLAGRSTHGATSPSPRGPRPAPTSASASTRCAS